MGSGFRLFVRGLGLAGCEDFAELERHAKTVGQRTLAQPAVVRFAPFLIAAVDKRQTPARSSGREMTLRKLVAFGKYSPCQFSG